MTFSVKFDGSVEKWAENVAEEMTEESVKLMMQAAELAAGEIRLEAFDAFPEGRGGLGRSFKATMLQSERGSLRSGALSDLVYARIQDKGGTITPRRRKALAVPVSPVAKKMRNHGYSAGDWPRDKLAMVWPKGKRYGLLVEARRRKTIVHYVLKKSVKLPATHYIDKAREQVEPKISELFEDRLVAAGKRAKAK